MPSGAVATTPLIYPGWRRVSEIADLVEIFEPDVQVCTCQRPIDTAITTYLSSLEPAGTLQVIETPGADGPLQLSRLPAGPGRECLIEDLSLLREILCELLGCPALGLRLARLGHAMCPGWHVDRTGIRLVCTYQGPGTEWLDDQAVDRSLLDPGREENPNFIQADVGEIVLLKGERWQGNEGLGAVHRSPDIPATTSLRTLVTMDPIWNS